MPSLTAFYIYSILYHFPLHQSCTVYAKENYRMFKCSNNILKPMHIRMNPPANTALFSYLLPHLLPSITPINDKINVIIPIKREDERILASANMAKVMPTANASMLVPMASNRISRMLKFSSTQLSLD